MSAGAPTTAKAWCFDKTTGGLENNLELREVKVPRPRPNQHVIRVIATSLNPVDYKPAEAPLLGSILLLFGKPATPGYDFAGELITPASGSSLKPGQLVFGGTGGPIFAGNGLSEYIAAPTSQVIAIPEGVDLFDAAALPVAGLTAYQTLKPHVKKGDRVLLIGGSGGVGHFGIQMAKLLDCHVTVICSEKNADFCKGFGADEVVDYTKGDTVESLKALGYQFDHVVDNVGSNHNLYWQSHHYTKPSAKYVNVASSPRWEDISFILKGGLLPKFLGGGQRKLQGFYAQPTEPDLRQLIDWVQEGKLKIHIETRYPMAEAPEAMRKLKTGRTRGKLVIEVASEKR